METSGTVRDLEFGDSLLQAAAGGRTPRLPSRRAHRPGADETSHPGSKPVIILAGLKAD